MGWFSGIVIDIYYDHVLGRDWGRYSAEPLAAFAARAHQALEAGADAAPADARHFIRRLIDNRYLTGYATPAGLADTLGRVSLTIAARIPKRAVWLPDALPRLAAADADLAADFHAFYPDLVAFAAGQRRAAG
jgi:acyl carrier protein phosphodiesterase